MAFRGAGSPFLRGTAENPLERPVERILLAHVREEDDHLRYMFRGKPGFGKDPADIPKHGEGLLIATGVVDAPRFGVLGHLLGQKKQPSLRGCARTEALRGRARYA